MVNTNDAQFEFVLAAAREMDRVLMLANKMTVASSENRKLLFQLAKAPINSLLDLNRDRFDDSESIRGRIAMLAQSLLTLRNLRDGSIIEDRSDGIGACPACETPILRYQNQAQANTNSNQMAWIVYCPECSDIYQKPLEMLSVHGVGFGTDRI
jgi:hypothetical protein